MPKYKLILKIKNSDLSCIHEIDLLPSQEDRPDRYFTPTITEEIRSRLQTQSLCLINDINLKRIIQNWTEDIQEGYRDSTITLDLPLLIDQTISQVNDHGYQEIPALLTPNLLEIEPSGGELPPLNFV